MTDSANYPYLYSSSPKPAWASALAAGLNQAYATGSPMSTRPEEGMLTGTTAARKLGEGISPIADVVMGNAARTNGPGASHKSMMVSGPPSPRLSSISGGATPASREEQEKTFT